MDVVKFELQRYVKLLVKLLVKLPVKLLVKFLVKLLVKLLACWLSPTLLFNIVHEINAIIRRFPFWICELRRREERR